MEHGTAQQPLTRHEVWHTDGNAELWEIAQHSVGNARSLIAFGERLPGGQWMVWCARPARITWHDSQQAVEDRLQAIGREREKLYAAPRIDAGAR